MEIALPGGGRFVFVFPVYVLMPLGEGGRPLLSRAHVGEKALLLYTDADLARRGAENQHLQVMAPVVVATPAELVSRVRAHAGIGVTHVGIDLHTLGDRRAGHLVPVSVFLD